MPQKSRANNCKKDIQTTNTTMKRTLAAERNRRNFLKTRFKNKILCETWRSRHFGGGPSKQYVMKLYHQHIDMFYKVFFKLDMISNLDFFN